MGVAEPLVQVSLLGEAIDVAQVAVFVTDEQTGYVAANRRACEALGYTRAELLELSVGNVAREAAATDEYDDVLAHGARTGSAQLTRKDGTTVTFRYTASKTTVAGMAVLVSIGELASS